jgi:hypothetical protein
MKIWKYASKNKNHSFKNQAKKKKKQPKRQLRSWFYLEKKKGYMKLNKSKQTKKKRMGFYLHFENASQPKLIVF